MGIALFHLEEYEESIIKCKEALENLDKLKDKEWIIRTIRCITDATIIMLGENQDNLLFENFKICKGYLDKLGDKYVKDIEDIRSKMKSYVEIDSVK